jgi:hypothetical protein
MRSVLDPSRHGRCAGGPDGDKRTGHLDPELLGCEHGVEQEQLAARALDSHHRLNRGPSGQPVQDRGDGNPFDRAIHAEPAADEAATGPDEAGAADLHVFDLAVGHGGEHRWLSCREHLEPVLHESHVIPPTRPDRRSRDVPSEVRHLAQDGQCAYVEFLSPAWPGPAVWWQRDSA